ncbi:MAG: substrate-binding domain-containing protein [Anaerolineae bacterium]|nr:substrate-binding domain-containing protein [Anaerolineae bacterium]
MIRRLALVFAVVLSLAGCAAPTSAPRRLILATTTSTADSGLLDFLLPDFEKAHNCDVQIIAVGTGQALALGAKGDADVVLVHDPDKEAAFVAGGDGVNRQDVMYNDFIIVGPPSDPAGVRGSATAAEAFARIAQAEAPFASRGDGSGTETREKAIWQAAGIAPDPRSTWYFSLGQGMGDTLLFASEKGAYTLADRGSYLSMRGKLRLALLLGGDRLDQNPDPALRNPYGVIAVNPAKHPNVQYDLALRFIDWLTSVETQRRILEFTVGGQPLFYPNSAAWKAR